MKKYEMSADLYTYVEAVDNQHQTLINLANELDDAIGKVSNQNIRDKLDFLGKYTAEHFSYEESLQRECDYPQFTEHCKQHDTFLDGWVDLKSDFFIDGKSPEQMQALIANNVIAWVVNHIFDSDKQFAEFYRAWKEQQIIDVNFQ